MAQIQEMALSFSIDMTRRLPNNNFPVGSFICVPRPDSLLFSRVKWLSHIEKQSTFNNRVFIE